jgi:uncharacterized protein
MEFLSCRRRRTTIRAMAAFIAYITVSPVKGLRLQQRDDVELTLDGVPGDRAFFLVDEDGAMVSLKRLGPLVTVLAEHDLEAQTLRLRLPDGSEVGGAVELDEAEPVRFYGLNLEARPLRGPFSAALSELCGVPVRLVSPLRRTGLDRGRAGAVTLLSLASLERLRLEAGETEPVDPRRFRMTFGIDGVDVHAEDGWIGRDVRVGDALLRVEGNVGRCAVTTRNADSGEVDFRTLHHLAGYRDEVETTERLPLGVYARVLEPGRVRLGDAVTPRDS